jgi:cytochrome c biogenesis protein CcdA
VLNRPVLEVSHEVLAFAIGVASTFLPCCFYCYPGLFAYFQPEGERSSRTRAVLVSLVFAAGAMLVAAILTVGFFLIAPFVRGVLPQAQQTVNVIAFLVLSAIGAVYLLGKTFSLPIPRLSLPGSMVGNRGYRYAYLYGVFVGGPGQAHCTLALMIPLVFLFFTSMTPIGIVAYFLLYTVGRIIPTIMIGLMVQDTQVRFAKSISAHSQAINRLIGVSFIIAGIFLLFTI